MKIVTAILVIFCIYLYAASEDSISSVNIAKHVVHDIENTIRNIPFKIIPRCIFGVESVSMILYTQGIEHGKNIGLDEVCVDFDRSKPIVFLVHGFISNANYSEGYELSKALVKKGVTVYSLDWSDASCQNGLHGVRLLGYLNAVQNTCEVGKLMAEYVISLIKRCNVSLDDIIFTGNSLGAHVTGFASKEIQKRRYGKIRLLLGVDPAWPLFARKGRNNRLHKTDAENVIVLHSSSIGITWPIGNVNLYFNGGYRQPGCLIMDLKCSHVISVLYLANIVNRNCGFPGVPISEPLYPQKNTTECFFMDRTMFNKNRNFNKLKGKTYYMFVDSNTFCTSDTFSCQH